MAKVSRRGFFGRALGGFAAALGLAKTAPPNIPEEWIYTAGQGFGGVEGEPYGVVTVAWEDWFQKLAAHDDSVLYNREIERYGRAYRGGR